MASDVMLAHGNGVASAVRHIALRTKRKGKRMTHSDMREFLAEVPSGAAGEATREFAERHERGLRTFTRIMGEERAPDLIGSISDVAPQFIDAIIGWAFGEIYARPELGLRDRSLVTLGVLTALGGCEPALETHVRAARNVGLTDREIVEVLLHATAYCGFPKAIVALLAVKDILNEPGGSGGDTDPAGTP